MTDPTPIGEDPEYEEMCDRMARAIFVLRNKEARNGTLCDEPFSGLKKTKRKGRWRQKYPGVWFCCGCEFGMRTKKCTQCGRWQSDSNDIRPPVYWDDNERQL